MLWRLVSDFDFWGPFWRGKWAWPPRWRLRVWGQKSWPTLGSSWVTCYLKIVLPEISDPGPPLRCRLRGGLAYFANLKLESKYTNQWNWPQYDRVVAKIRMPIYGHKP